MVARCFLTFSTLSLALAILTGAATGCSLAEGWRKSSRVCTALSSSWSKQARHFQRSALTPPPSLTRHRSLSPHLVHLQLGALNQPSGALQPKALLQAFQLLCEVLHVSVARVQIGGAQTRQRLENTHNRNHNPLAWQMERVTTQFGLRWCERCLEASASFRTSE